MAGTQVKVQMQQRRDTAAGWVSGNPTLLSGELGHETDTGKWKVGDGSSAWNSLSYSFINDLILEGTSKAEILESGTNGLFLVTLTNYERFRIGPAGQIGIAGANYGTSGQALLSGGMSGSVTWGVVGATGGGTDQWALEHENTITTSYSISTGKNVISAGPLTVNAGVIVTVPAASSWVIA